MKDLVKQYLDNGISRRKLMKGLSAVGLSTVAAKTMAQALAPATARAAEAGPGAIRAVTGTGGRLFTQQLKSAGVEYLFCNPSTGDAAIYDALVDEPAIQLIKGIQEGAVVAMADGFARLSGKTGIVGIANISVLRRDMPVLGCDGGGRWATASVTAAAASRILGGIYHRG